MIDISQPNKDDKTIFVWPEGILPDVSQEELVEFKWLFEESLVKIIYYLLELIVKKLKKKKLIISIPYQFMIII